VITWDELVRLAGCSHDELRRCIDEGWIVPDPDDGFAEADLARLHLILELRRDLAIDDEAMPVVLSLLDQVYLLRRQLRLLSTLVEPR
jgi:chaperone modulatory protein CbpM